MINELAEIIGEEWRENPIVLALLSHDESAVVDGDTNFQQIRFLTEKQQRTVLTQLYDPSLVPIWKAKWIPWKTKSKTILAMLEKNASPCLWRNLGRNPEVDESRKVIFLSLYLQVQILERTQKGARGLIPYKEIQCAHRKLLEKINQEIERYL